MEGTSITLFSFNYNLIFVLSSAFNLTNLKSRGYPDEEVGGQEKSRTTQEQGNSKLVNKGQRSWSLVDGGRPVTGGGGGRRQVGGGIPAVVAGGEISAVVADDRWAVVVS
ncbi:unnamed protein product [Prunus armeniaca]